MVTKGFLSAGAKHRKASGHGMQHHTPSPPAVTVLSDPECRSAPSHGYCSMAETWRQAPGAKCCVVLTVRPHARAEQFGIFICFY